MRKAFNVTDKDFDILPYLDKQVNISQFIINLIKQDMGKRKVITEDQIIDLIKKYATNPSNNFNTKFTNPFPMDTVLRIME